MANSSLSNPPHLNQAKYVARNAATSRWMTALARLGYACKGVVYLLVGVFAVQLALGDGGRAPDNTAALQAIYAQPFGKFLLIVVMIGLCGFALWSLIQALFDTEGKGRNVKGSIARLGYAGVAVAYAALAFGAFHLITGSGSSGKSSDATAQDWTARLLNQHFGVALVVVAGVVAFGVAFTLFQKAYKATFRQKLRVAALRPQIRQAIFIVGRSGYAAIGVVAALIGIFLIVAALQHNPGEAKGLGGALVSLLHQPFGPLLLGIVAVGLLAYGVYSFVEARYRRLGPS
jgi:hypothetical protein